MTSITDQLADVRRRAADLRTEERSLVAQARRDGCSWSTIAQALGISPQACHRRYRERAPDIESRPLSDPLFDPLFSDMR